MHTQMCTLNVILHHLNYLWYGPGRPISLQGNSHTTCNLQWAKQPPKKTNRKARKNTLTFKNHHVVESRKRGKQVHQVFVCWTLPRALLPLPHTMQIQSPWYKNGIDSLDCIACVKYQFPLPTQCFFTKNLHIHVSGLVPPNISSPCDNLNTTNELDVANWTSAGTCIVHKNSVHDALAALFTHQAMISDKMDFWWNFYSSHEFLQLKEEDICYGTPKLLVFFTW